MKHFARFASRSFPWPGRTPSRAALGTLLTLTVLLAVTSAHGQVRRWIQPVELPPITHIYNIGATEFPIGAWVHSFSPQTRIADLWPFASSMGFDILESSLYLRGGNELETNWNKMLQLDTLSESPYAVDSGMRFWSGPYPIGTIGGNNLSNGGQAVELYPFDSTQCGPVAFGTDRAYWLFAGVDSTKGTITYNSYYNGQADRLLWPWRGRFPGERVFDDAGDAGLVAEHIAFVDPAPYTYQNPYTIARSAQDATTFLDVFGGSGNNDLYTVLSGHMFLPLDSNVAPTDTIFTVRLYHEVPNGAQYVDDALNTQTATGFTEIVIDSFAVTKAQLTVGAANLSEYREAPHLTDLRYKFNDPNRVGPLHSSQLALTTGSRRMDVKVYWTGKERAALRSISLRNPIAELMMGKTQQSIDFRKEVLDTARRVLRNEEVEFVDKGDRAGDVGSRVALARGV